MKACIGSMVLLVDLLCVCALHRPAFHKHIDETGETATGIIEDITIIPLPNQLDTDDWVKKVRYSFTVSYEAGSKKYMKKFSPTLQTSKREIYPLDVDKGNYIGIKYCKRLPGLSIIDVDALKAGMKTERERTRIFFIAVPVIITMLYIVSVI